MEDFLKLLRQGKIQVHEVELVPHMHTTRLDDFMLQTVPEGRYTLRILYKEIK